MTIWILAIVVIGITAAIGYSQGGIRMGVSFIGIIFATLLATIAGKLTTPILGAFGLKNPVLLWALPPLIGFILVSIVFEIIGVVVHRKVDVYYKYKAGDLRLALWERINARLGACVGVLSGTAYVVLISFLIYAISYCTIQMASADTDPRSIRIVNALGRDLESTKMTRAARAVDSLGTAFYDTADLAGLLYRHPLLEARLLRYPGLLALGERQEFQGIASDKNFSEARLRGATIQEVLDNPSAQAVFSNPELLRTLWQTLTPDLADLGYYLTNGVSKKYEDKLLGRWVYDSSGTISAYRRAKPNTTSLEAQKMKAFMRERFGQVTMVAAPGHELFLKNMPQGQPGAPGANTAKNLKGTWKEDGSTSYEFDLEGGTDRRKARFEGSRLVVTASDGLSLAFVRID